MSEQELLYLFKKYVYVCGQDENKHLAFRNISIKKHSQDFEAIVKFLEEAK